MVKGRERKRGRKREGEERKEGRERERPLDNNSIHRAKQQNTYSGLGFMQAEGW